MQDVIHRCSPRLDVALRALDVFGLWTAGQLSALMSFDVPLSSSPPVHSVLLYFGCALSVILFSKFNMYGSWRGRSMPSLFLQAALAWAAVMMLALLFSFLIHHVDSLSRLWMFHWYVLGVLSLMVTRATVHFGLRHLRRKGYDRKRVIIIGYGKLGREMHALANTQSWSGYDVRGVLPCQADEEALEGVERIVSIGQLPEYVARLRISEIWITLPLSDRARLQQLQFALRNALVDIRWVPDTMSMQMLSSRLITFLGMPALDLNCPVAANMNGIAKDAFDKLFSAVVVFLLLPLFLAIGIAIRLGSAGPIFLREPRLGLNGRIFECFKFRTIKLDEEHGTVKQATQDGSRVTRVGRYLRRTGLDELPQFINVLRGDMSVVGPRPLAVEHNNLYKDKFEMYMLRHRVKPGVTGWAQIHGYRGEADSVDKMAQRVQFDLHYIRNWSFGLDIKIIVRTTFGT